MTSGETYIEMDVFARRYTKRSPSYTHHENNELSSCQLDSSKSRCFICPNDQASLECRQNIFSNSGFIGSISERLKTMRIVCQILRVEWNLLEEQFSNKQNLFPFCQNCLELILSLVRLRERLVQLETEIRGVMREVELTVAASFEPCESEEESSEEYADDEFTHATNLKHTSRYNFQRGIFSEHSKRDLLAKKIMELKRDNEENIMEMEPSFVQLHMETGRVITEESDIGGRWQSKYQKKRKKEKVEVSNGARESGRGQRLTRRASGRIRMDIKEEPSESDPDEGFQLASSPCPQDFLELKEEKMDEDCAFTEGDEEESSTEENDDSNDSDFLLSTEKRRKESTLRTKKTASGVVAAHDDATRRVIYVKLEPKSRQKSRTEESRKARKRFPKENFGKLQEGEDGRVFYEGVEIVKNPGAPGRGTFVLKCGSCFKEYDENQGKRHRRDAYKLMQIHIKGIHLKSYSCSICGKGLRDARTLRLHMERKHIRPKAKRKPRTSHKNGDYPIDMDRTEDGRLFYDCVEIIRVELDDGSGDFEVRCGLCEKSIRNAHVQRYRQSPFRLIINHIKGKHKGEYKCTTCEKVYANAKYLRKHIFFSHGTAGPENICDICGKTIDSYKKYMRIHKWSHKNAQERAAAIAAGEKEPLKYSEMLEKRKSKSGPNFQCADCGKRFQFLCMLTRHEHVHRQERTHQCSYCGKFYSTLENLNTHIKFVHENERVHKVYFCQHCDKRITTKSAWEKHERTHTKETPFSCPVCNKRFALKQSVGSHLKKCKGVVGSSGTVGNYKKKLKRKRSPVSEDLPKRLREVQSETRSVGAYSTASSPDIHPELQQSTFSHQPQYIPPPPRTQVYNNPIPHPLNSAFPNFYNPYTGSHMNFDNLI